MKTVLLTGTTSFKYSIISHQFFLPPSLMRVMWMKPDRCWPKKLQVRYLNLENPNISLWTTKSLSFLFQKSLSLSCFHYVNILEKIVQNIGLLVFLFKREQIENCIITIETCLTTQYMVYPLEYTIVSKKNVYIEIVWCSCSLHINQDKMCDNGIQIFIYNDFCFACSISCWVRGAECSITTVDWSNFPFYSNSVCYT